MVDLDAAFDQELFDIAIGQGVAQVPADRDHGDLGWEPEPGEGGSRSGNRAWAAYHAEIHEMLDRLKVPALLDPV